MDPRISDSTPFKNVSREAGVGVWGRLDFFIWKRLGGSDSDSESESDSILLLWYSFHLTVRFHDCRSDLISVRFTFFGVTTNESPLLRTLFMCSVRWILLRLCTRLTCFLASALFCRLYLFRFTNRRFLCGSLWPCKPGTCLKKQSYSKLGWIWWWSHIQSRVATRLQSDMEEMKNKRGYLVTGVWPTSETTATIRSSKEGWGWNKLPAVALFSSFPPPSSVISHSCFTAVVRVRSMFTLAWVWI